MNSTIHNAGSMEIALKQTRDKFINNTNAFLYLILMQLIGYFFSFNAGMNGSGSNELFIALRTINPLPLHILTILWILVMGLNLAGEKSREYYMVSNNFTAYFSDIALIEIFSVIGGLTLMFAGPFLQVLGSIFFENVQLDSAFADVGLLNHLVLFLTSTLYLLIFGTLAYAFGIFRMRFKARFILGSIGTVVLLILASIFAARIGTPTLSFDPESLIGFYYYEQRPLMWLLKVIFTVAGLYGISYLGIRNLEVND